MFQCVSLPASTLWCFAVRQVSKCLAVAGIAVVLSSASALSQESKPLVSCESLAKLSLASASIDTSEIVPAGTFKLPPQPGPQAAANPFSGPAPQGEQPLRRGTPAGHEPIYASKLPAFCRVTATLKPSGDSDIKIEVWLPLDNWNGKFIGAGNSGWAGRINQQDLVAPIAAGYAVAGTDTGHTTNGGSFIIGHPEKLIDYTWRADHEMTLKAKEIIKAFYGNGPRYSYWIGCSLGGQEALIEAAKFPEDYNGIIAGAPLNPIVIWNAAQMWPSWLISKNPEKLIPGPKWYMIHDAVMQKCGSLVDLQLGYLSAPAQCDFKPSSLLCKSGDAPDCLTAPQVEFLTQYYEGPKNPRTGEHIYHGVPKGGEADMTRDGGANPVGVAVDMYKYAVFQDPNWDWKSLDYDKDIEKADKTVDPLFRAYPEQVAEYLRKGGKLLIHMGGTEGFDGSDIVDLADSAVKQAGGQYKDSIKLFEFPGMNHCGGGLGCDVFDKIETIDSWVAQGKPPESLTAYKVDDWKVIRTRTVCAWPMVSRYKGTGSVDVASSYTCSR